MKWLWVLCVALLCVACTKTDNSIHQGAGSTANTANGSGSAAGSAPCAATGTQNKGSVNSGGTNGSSSDCSSKDDHSSSGVPVAEQKVGGMKSLTGIDLADIR